MKLHTLLVIFLCWSNACSCFCLPKKKSQSTRSKAKSAGKPKKRNRRRKNVVGPAVTSDVRQAQANDRHSFRHRLFRAIKENNDRSVKILCKRKDANIDEADDYGWTALHSAAESGHNKIVEILLEYGAHAEVSSQYAHEQKDVPENSDREIKQVLRARFTPLIVAALNGHVNVVESLLVFDLSIWDSSRCEHDRHENCLVSATHTEIRGALSVAQDAGHHEVVKVLSELAVQVGIPIEQLKTESRYIPSK